MNNCRNASFITFLYSLHFFYFNLTFQIIAIKTWMVFWRDICHESENLWFSLPPWHRLVDFVYFSVKKIYKHDIFVSYKFFFYLEKGEDESLADVKLSIQDDSGTEKGRPRIATGVGTVLIPFLQLSLFSQILWFVLVYFFLYWRLTKQFYIF